MRISQRDFAILQRAILELHEFRDIVSLRRGVSAVFLALIRADSFVLADLRVLKEQRRAQWLDSWESGIHVPDMVNERVESLMFHHPFVQHALRRGDSGALLLSDFLTLRQLRETDLYRTLLGPARVGRMLGVGSLQWPGSTWLTFTRKETDRDFLERDRRMLELIRPHFDQARANLTRETELRARRSSDLRARGLTPRETEIALWLAQGKSNLEIGSILATPVRTVEKHVERILAKLGVENRAAAAVAIATAIRA